MKSNMKKTTIQLNKIFLNAILAGLFIGMAGTVYLATPNPLLGAFLFGFGLLIILCYEFKLFTGAIGYLVNQGENRYYYLLVLIIIWAGNLIGCYSVGMAVRNSRTSLLVVERARKLCEIKLADNSLSIFILAIFCGILMYLAVESFRKKSEYDAVIRLPIVFLCVSIFILCGFEHCIANMYYFSVSDMWSTSSFASILLMTLGNSIGGMLIPICDKVR